MFGVFSLWFFLHFVQVNSRVIPSYMSRESNTIEQSLLSSQGPGLLLVEEEGYRASLLEKLLILMISRTMIKLHSKTRIHTHNSVLRFISQPFQQHWNISTILSALAQFTKGNFKTSISKGPEFLAMVCNPQQNQDI